MEGQCFRLEIQLKTPAILHPLLTLDALLAAALYRETNDLERAHNALPLLRREGVWSASSVQLVDGMFVGLPFVSRLSKSDLDPARWSDRNRAGKARVQVNGGTYMSKLSQHRAWIGTLAFDAAGDGDEACRLLGSLAGIGAKTTQGCGQIESISLVEGGSGGICAADGTPARPVPVELWSTWYAPVQAVLVIDEVSWHPPYYTTPKSRCVVPSAVS